jgi:hypothetical protein
VHIDDVAHTESQVRGSIAPAAAAATATTAAAAAVATTAPTASFVAAAAFTAGRRGCSVVVHCRRRAGIAVDAARRGRTAPLRFRSFVARLG